MDIPDEAELKIAMSLCNEGSPASNTTKLNLPMPCSFNLHHEPLHHSISAKAIAFNKIPERVLHHT